MDYYLKYLKYKNKYLSLKNQLGGDWKCVCTRNNVNGNLECATCGRARPRAAGNAGAAARQETDEKNKKLDTQLQKNMGSSEDEVTKTGNARKEYHGK
jgi:hypothetical protein